MNKSYKGCGVIFGDSFYKDMNPRPCGTIEDGIVFLCSKCRDIEEAIKYERKRIFNELDYALCYGIISHVSEEEIEKVNELLKYLLDNKIKATIYRDLKGDFCECCAELNCKRHEK